MREKPREIGIGPSLVLVMLFLAGFAYGLRWIDHRLTPPPDRYAPTPARELDHGVSGQLSEAFRFVFGIRTVHAADYTTWSGTMVGKAPVITMAPGEYKTIDLAFKNTGRATWSNSGKSYVSAYTIKPRYHASVFRSVGWASASQTPRLLTGTVKPGETGILRLSITAPAKAGTYTDTIQLAAEDTSWMWGAWTPITVKVSGAPVAAPAAPAPVPAAAPAPTVVTTSAATLPLAASLSWRSAERIEAPGGLPMTMRVSYRNDGTAAWKRVALHLTAFKSPSGDATIDDPSWASKEIPVVVDRIVVPNQSIELVFSFTTPRTKGDYQMTLALAADDAQFAQPLVIPIKVISDAWTVIVPETPSSPAPLPILTPSVTPSVGDPLLRVGLYTTEKPEEITFDGPFNVRDSAGTTLASFDANARVQFRYDLPTRTYSATDGIKSVSSASPIRFAPTNAGSVFTLLTHDDRPSWNSSVNYNRYRGGLEIRKNDRNDYVWIINELPMEQYLKGMNETSSVSPVEYQKTMAVAARSYANWHLTHPGKHWHFTVDATYDQVYKGYVAEAQNPVMAGAVDATRGMIVTHNGIPVVTPYFSSSDGRTRDWTEVWGGGAKAWLVSVPAPFDAAAKRPLFGHGVGLSAWDAIGRANAGATYDVILKYYYTGTDLKKLY